MFVLASMNLLVAFTMTDKFWSLYALITPTGSFLVLFAAQYLMFRRNILAKIHERASAQTI
jgi:hypothetical protein